MSGKRVLVAYASKHGSTVGIAEAIADRLRDSGHDAEARAVQVADPREVEAVVLGSAIYAGSWMNEAIEFAERHVDTLRQVPTWLFSSGPLGVEVRDEEEQPRQLGRLTEALHPRGHQVFFGALDRTKLGFGERMMVKAVKASEGDFRDWDAIRSWAADIAQALAPDARHP